MYKFFQRLIILSICLIPITSHSVEDNTEDLKNYIRQLMSDTMGLLDSQNISLDDKVAKAKSSLEANMDFDSMSKQSLGRINYNKMNEAEFSEYKQAYRAYLINAYGKGVNNYDGQVMNIKSVEQVSSNQYLVRTEIVDHKKSQSISMDFYVKSIPSSNSKAFKVLDIVTEGISLIQTQQTQFNSIIESEGVEGLIKMLKKKSG
jgi:phospholipid transport system substrate-binding protein